MWPIHALLERQGRRYRDRVVCYSDEGTLSYANLLSGSAGMAAGLSAWGLRPNGRVVILSGEHPQTLLAYGACAWGGYAGVPLAETSTVSEVAFVLADSQASVILCSAENRDLAEQAIDAAGISAREEKSYGHLTALLLSHGVEPDEWDAEAIDPILVIPYTSGTTGQPKGVIQKQSAHLENAIDYACFYTMAEESVILSALPHSAGLLVTTLMPALLVGGAIALMEMGPWRADTFYRTVQTFGVTHTELVPTQLLRVLDADAPEDALRTLTALGYGSAPTPPALVDAALERFGPILLHMYGLTEALSLSAGLSRRDHLDHDLRGTVGSVGYPVGRTTMWVEGPEGEPLEPGQHGSLVVSSPKVCPGYWNRPDESAQTFARGILRTGDVAYCTPRGTLVVIDRDKDLIKAGGAAVSPAEIDALLGRHAAVSTSLTFGVPDPVWGERVVAAVVLRPDEDQLVVRDELFALCRRELSPHKVPKEIMFQEDLPMNAVGKVLRRQLTAGYLSGSLDARSNRPAGSAGDRGVTDHENQTVARANSCHRRW